MGDALSQCTVYIRIESYDTKFEINLMYFTVIAKRRKHRFELERS